MICSSLRSAFLLNLIIAASLSTAFTGTAHGADYAIVGGTVHTQTNDQPLQQAVILVSDGRISAVGADLAVPAGYEIVAAAGKVVTPGLIDSYSQLTISEIGGEASTVDSQVVAYASGPAFDVRYALNPEATALAVNRRDGVTRAVVAPRPGNDPLAGWGVTIRLSDVEPLVSTDVALFGALGANAAMFTGGSRSALIQRLRRGLQQARGYSTNRYQPGPGDYSHQDLAALQRFLKADVPLVLEAHRAVEIREAVKLAEDFDLQLVVLGGTEAWKESAQLAVARVPVVVNVLANLPTSFERLGARLDNAALLHEAGVQVLFTGGETQNVRWLRQAAGNAVAYGMPWSAALRAATASPGSVWSFPEGTGTLAKGAPADLVIWNGDPLELSNWPERLMIDGEWQSLESRQTRLFERYQDLSDDNLYYQ
jgi:imidazolonepropionase-like amidohydrolase